MLALLRRRRALASVATAVCAALVGGAVPGARAAADNPNLDNGRRIQCVPQDPTAEATAKALGQFSNDCLPTPIECATGAVPAGRYETVTGAFADCLGGGGHLHHWVGGYLGDDNKHGVCGGIVDEDVIVAGNWEDPNHCDPVTEAATTGRGFAGTVHGRGGAVSSESSAAAKVGLDVLSQGGNAVDAAVAAGFAIGVTQPDHCGLGAAGALVYRSAQGDVKTLDFEAAAPLNATADDFDFGDQTQAYNFPLGHKAVAVPGFVAGMIEANKLGTKSLAELIAPSIALARQGVPVSQALASSYGTGFGLPVVGVDPLWLRMADFKETAATYLRDGKPPAPANSALDSRLPEYGTSALAHSLELIQKYGRSAFYDDRDFGADGPSIGHQILEEMRNAQSSPIPGDAPVPWQAADLSSYQARWGVPATTTYRGAEVYTPAFSSGILTIEHLNLLEQFPMPAENTADRIHLTAEAEKIAFYDWYSKTYDGMPASVVAQLTSKTYAAERKSDINLNGTNDPGASTAAASSATRSPAAGHTTHISVIDRAGNAVAFTCTVGYPFGSLVVAPGTGFVLNSQLMTFWGKDDPNQHDEVEPGKRPRSTKTPVIVVRKGRPILVIGGAGGSLVSPAVVETIVHMIDDGKDAAHAQDAARYWDFCDTKAGCAAMGLGSGSMGLTIEDARIPQDQLERLQQLGHTTLNYQAEYSDQVNTQAVGLDISTAPPEFWAASDPRGDRGAGALPR